MLGVGKRAVQKVELPFQPAGFSELSSEPVPDPDPEHIPELRSISLLLLHDILSDREFLVDLEASVSVFPGPRSDSSE